MIKKIRGFPIFLVVLGFIFLLDTLGIYDGAFVKLWPVLLILVGMIKIINSYLENRSYKTTN